MTLIQKATGFLTISKDWVGLRISTLEKVELAEPLGRKRNASGYIDTRTIVEKHFAEPLRSLEMEP